MIKCELDQDGKFETLYPVFYTEEDGCPEFIRSINDEIKMILELYPETWEIISSAEACVFMRDMAANERPTVEAFVRVPIFSTLDEMVWQQRKEEQESSNEEQDIYDVFHTVVGRLCKQVMKNLGFIPVIKNSRQFSKDTCPESRFTQGTVYHRKPKADEITSGCNAPQDI